MLVTNEEAVLKLTSHGPESKPCGLNGWIALGAEDQVEREPEESEKTIRAARVCLPVLSWLGSDPQDT